MPQNNVTPRVERMFPDWKRNATAEQKVDNKKQEEEMTPKQSFEEDQYGRAYYRHSCTKPDPKVSRTEVQEKSSTVTIQLGKKSTWSQFMAVSNELQKEYVLDMISRYPSIATFELCEMWGVSRYKVEKVMKKLDIKFTCGGNMPVRKEMRERFRNEVIGGDPVSSKHYYDGTIDISKPIEKGIIRQMPSDDLYAYIATLITKYPGIRIKHIAEAINVSQPTAAKIMSKLDLTGLVNRGRMSKKDIKSVNRFYEDLFGRKVEEVMEEKEEAIAPKIPEHDFGSLEDLEAACEEKASGCDFESLDALLEEVCNAKVPDEEESNKYAEEENPGPDIEVSSVTFECCACDIQKALDKFGIVGRVKVSITTV